MNSHSRTSKGPSGTKNIRRVAHLIAKKALLLLAATPWGWEEECDHFLHLQRRKPRHGEVLWASPQVAMLLSPRAFSISTPSPSNLQRCGEAFKHVLKWTHSPWMPTFLDPEIVSCNTVLPSVSGSAQGAGGQRWPSLFSVLWLCGTCRLILRSDDRAHARSMTHSASVCKRPNYMSLIELTWLPYPLRGRGREMVCPVTQPEACLPHVAREVEWR